MALRLGFRRWFGPLAAMLALLALIGFWPSPVDQPAQGFIAWALQKLHARGVPGWFDYGFVERAANVALFVPLGIIATFTFPRRRWWQIGALGLLVSGTLEMGQWLFLPARYPSITDLITNSSGAVIGALVALWLARESRN